MTASVVLFEGRSVFEPSRSLTLEAARRRTKLVRAMRAVLALAILALLGGVGYFIGTSAVSASPMFDAGEVSGERRADNIEFTSQDSSGTPYVVTMDSAEQADGGSRVWELASPQLDFSAAGADADTPGSLVQADRGVYNQSARTLDLIGHVSFSTDNGYMFESAEARAYVDEGRVIGDEEIIGAGPLGSIRAQSWEIRDSGDRVVFSGDVVARLYPDRPDAPTTPDGFPGATFAPDALVPSSPRENEDGASSGADPAIEVPAPPREPGEGTQTP